MKFKKYFIISLVITLLLASSVQAGLLDDFFNLFKEDTKGELTNVQLSKNNIAYMNIQSERPRVVSSIGSTALLDYKIEKSGDSWVVTYCHKDYEKNYVSVVKGEQDEFKDISITSVKGAPKEVPINLTADKECGTFVYKGSFGDSIKIGTNSTIIEILDDNITFVITPEYQSCNYLSCDSQIIIDNTNDYDVIINSSDLAASIEGVENSYITFDYYYVENITVNDYNCTGIYNCTLIGNHTVLKNKLRTANIDEGLEINIPVNQSKIFDLFSIMGETNSQFKYNVSFTYLEVEYLIDPFFNTTNSSFDNGVYNQTVLNESGFVQLGITNRLASAILNVTGVTDAGNLTSIQSIDGDSYNVSEATGTPGYDVRINFSGVILPVSVNMFGRYVGSGGHTVLLSLWNYSGSEWIDAGVITSGSLPFIWYNNSIPNLIGGDFVSGGITQVRIYHVSPGNINHDIYIDYIELVEAPTRNGTYTSEIFNSGEVSEWNNISWESNAIGELPANQAVETNFVTGNANMTGNLLLFHLDESSGAVQDYSGNNYNGVYNGASYLQPGKINYSIGFNGIDELILTNNTVTTHGASTLCAWIKSDSTAVGIIDNLGGTGSNVGTFLRISGGGKINYGVGDGDGSLTFNMFSGDRIINDEEWHLLCGSWDGTTNADKAITYVDGTEEETVTADEAASGAPASKNLSVGATTGVTDWLNGSIDEVFIFNRALSATEIMDIYTRGTVRLNLVVRSCNDAVCSGESFTEYNNTSPQDLLESVNQYFQYKFAFETDNASFSPRLYNVSVSYTNLTLEISDVSYTAEVPLNGINNFTWTTNFNSNTSVRVWNDTLVYDDTNSINDSVTSHLITSDSLSLIGIYNFNITSCSEYSCASVIGNFSVGNVNIVADLNHTSYMRNESISSTGVYDELRVNYTVSGILKPGYNIECYLKYPNASTARDKVNLTDLGDGWYNYSEFYTFPTDVVVGTYVISCENLNVTFTQVQNIELFNIGTCNITADSRILNDNLEYTFNETFINVRNEVVSEIQEQHNLTNNGSDNYIHYDNSNQYTCTFNYTILDPSLTVDYNTYNYLENINETTTQSRIIAKMTLSDVVQFSYDFSSLSNLIEINSSYTEGLYVLKVWNLSTNLSEYYYDTQSLNITNVTVQTISYPTTREKSNSNDNDLCLDLILLRNVRNDTNITFNYTMAGYGTNGTCLINVNDQLVGNYTFNITTIPTDGLNAPITISYNYSIEPFVPDPSTIEGIAIADLDDTGDFIAGYFTVYVKVADDESDLVNITSVQWVVSGVTTFPVMNTSAWSLTNLISTPTGVWHNFTINAKELGNDVYPGVRLYVEINGGNYSYSTYFLVDNTDVFDIPVEPTNIITDLTIQSPCNSTCNVSFTLATPGSDTIAITNLEWVLAYPTGVTFGVINTSLLQTGLATSPSGVTHSFIMNSEVELGRYVYPGTRMQMQVTGLSTKISNYFLVDNIQTVLISQDVWTYNGRYINGEVI